MNKANKLKVSIICSDANHPVNPFLNTWIQANNRSHSITLVRKPNELTDGDILFAVACSSKISQEARSRFGVALVLHTSDLPLGRGWSPQVWEIARGASELTLSLFEMDETIDAGRIARKVRLNIPRHALWNEINEILYQAKIKLMDFAVTHFPHYEWTEQNEAQATYWPRRSPKDSEISAELPLAQQFDLLRVCDPDRYPAFIKLRGHTYKLKLEKADE